MLLPITPVFRVGSHALVVLQFETFTVCVVGFEAAAVLGVPMVTECSVGKHALVVLFGPFIPSVAVNRVGFHEMVVAFQSRLFKRRLVLLGFGLAHSWSLCRGGGLGFLS